MPLSDQLQDLESIAALVVAEHSIIRAMRRDGEVPEPQAEATSIAAGIAQWALLHKPMLLECVDLETTAAFAEA